MFPMLVQPLSSHGGFDSGAMGRISLLKRGLSWVHNYWRAPGWVLHGQVVRAIHYCWGAGWLWASWYHYWLLYLHECNSVILKP